jgi:hypothetical protein
VTTKAIQRQFLVYCHHGFALVQASIGEQVIVIESAVRKKIPLTYGGFKRMFLQATRIFARHAFATPLYTFTTQFKHVVLGSRGFHLVDASEIAGFENRDCGRDECDLRKIIERQPDYGNGKITLKVADTRFMTMLPASNEIAAVGDAIPDSGSASTGQRASTCLSETTPDT